MQGLGNIAPVAKELPTEPCGESRHGRAIVDIAWRQAKGQQFALVLDDAVGRVRWRWPADSKRRAYMGSKALQTSSISQKIVISWSIEAPEEAG